jgi:excisionase family DNA binding protein
MQDERVLLSVDEAARRLSVGLTVMYELLARDEIASCKLGRRRLIPAVELERFAERKLQEAGAAP